MGMVKRVLYTATGGSCWDPEAVSWSRNKTGDKDFPETSSPNRGMTFKTYCVLNHTTLNLKRVHRISLFFTLECDFVRMSQLICLLVLKTA